ncbi:hypothetical protein G9A89_003953 [Geosiphon pyriformis]|nr:hypothetical protein G9A89_003953 [Geosiphon pyriformis]
MAAERHHNSIHSKIQEKKSHNFLVSGSMTEGGSRQILNRRLIPLDNPIIQKFKKAAYYTAGSKWRGQMPQNLANFHEPELDDQDNKILFLPFHNNDLAREWALSPMNLVKYPQDFSGGKVEETVLKHFQAVKSDVASRIEVILNTHPTVKKIIFTGSFIRGALAVLFALDTKKWLIEKNLMPKYQIEVITFGSPRMGNLQFAQYVNSRLQVFRVTHGDSYLPQIPIQTNGNAGYFHFEKEYWIKPVKSCDCPPEKATIIGYELYVCFGVRNHNENYVEEPEVSVLNSIS